MAKLTNEQRKAMFAKWGFDLTDFKPDGFKKVLKGLELQEGTVFRTFHEDPEGVGRGFVWKNDHVTIETKNNPITGQYGTDRMREPEINYAGYIGIEGDRAHVLKAVKLIKQNASEIKDESPNNRDFI